MKNKKKLSLPVMIWIISLILIALLVNISITEHKPFLYVMKTHLRTSVILIVSNLLVIILHVIKRSKARYYIEKIENLDWSKADPKEIIYVSFFSAIEFAESLRQGASLYSSLALDGMIKGELQTDNLKFEDYDQRGDHCEFLRHFIKKYYIRENTSYSVASATNSYRGFCGELTKEERFETIISREHALPGIFQKILDSHDWEKLGFGFYAYYLREHIRIDSEDGGHGDLMKEMKIKMHEDVLKKFWKARYKMYKSLFKS